MLTELAVVLALRTQGPALRSMPSALLLATTLAVGATAVAMPYVAPVATAFDFVPLSWPLVGALGLIVACYVGSTEAIKLRVLRGGGH